MGDNSKVYFRKKGKKRIHRERVTCKDGERGTCERDSRRKGERL